MLGGFARLVGIDLSEAEHPVEAYPSLNHFFVRRLRPGIRPVSGDPGLVVSPVDGVAGMGGEVREGELVQAKGRRYSAAALLGDPGAAEPYLGGRFLTIYLSPRHYHRIHAPCPGRILEARVIPGGLLPVNRPAVAHVPGLFARNERLVVHLEGPAGRVALVAVGATNVGAISARFDPRWGGDDSGEAPPPDDFPPPSPEEAVRRAHPPRPVTNRRRPPELVRCYAPPIPVQVGEEILAFHLGSTVVLLAEPGRFVPLEGIHPGAELRLGTPVWRAEGG